MFLLHDLVKPPLLQLEQLLRLLHGYLGLPRRYGGCRWLSGHLEGPSGRKLRGGLGGDLSCGFGVCHGFKAPALLHNRRKVDSPLLLVLFPLLEQVFGGAHAGLWLLRRCLDWGVRPDELLAQLVERFVGQILDVDLQIIAGLAGRRRIEECGVHLEQRLVC